MKPSDILLINLIFSKTEADFPGRKMMLIAFFGASKEPNSTTQATLRNMVFSLMQKEMYCIFLLM